MQGKCPHGEFEIEKGCPQCIAERTGSEVGKVVKVEEDEVGLHATIELTPGGEEKLKEIGIIPPDETTSLTKSLLEESAAYPQLDAMSDLDLVKLQSEVADSKDPSDIAFKKAVLSKLRERHIAACELEEPAAETSLTKPLGSDAEMEGYYTEAVKLQHYAEAQVIATTNDVKEANDNLSILAKFKKAMEGRKRECLAPLKEKAEAITETYKTLMTPVLVADKVTRDKVLAYNIEQTRIRAEQEEVNRLRMEAAQAEMALKGELTESVNLVEVAPEVPTTIRTDLGSASKTMIKKWEVEDFSQVPNEYKMIDASKVGKVVRAGIPSISGIKIWEEATLRITPRKS